MEIGSFLEFEDTSLYIKNPDKDINNFTLPFMQGKNYQTNFYQNARNATEALCLHLKKTTSCVILPDYVCSTVSDSIIRAGLKVVFYHILPDFDFDINEINSLMLANTLSDSKPILYLVHYFGKPMNISLINCAKEWISKGYIIFEDITMSIFSKDENNFGFGTYIIGSLRKWLPIPDGGFITTINNSLPSIPEYKDVSKYCHHSIQAQELKREYISGGEKDKLLKDNYMNLYKKSIEYLFSDYTIYPVSGITENYLSNYSLDSVIIKRLANYKYFYNRLLEFDFVHPIISLHNGYLPFGMIVEVDNRDELLSFLVSNDVYCNVHWRLDHKDMGPEAHKLSSSIMTIPCDQRYCNKDFDRIIEVLKSYSHRG